MSKTEKNDVEHGKEKGNIRTKKKKYYVADDEYMDAFYGWQTPICVDRKELKWLADEWGVPLKELLNEVHEASDEEIAEYGISEGVN